MCAQEVLLEQTGEAPPLVYTPTAPCSHSYPARCEAGSWPGRPGVTAWTATGQSTPPLSQPTEPAATCQGPALDPPACVGQVSGASVTAASGLQLFCSPAAGADAGEHGRACPEAAGAAAPGGRAGALPHRRVAEHAELVLWPPAPLLPSPRLLQEKHAQAGEVCVEGRPCGNSWPSEHSPPDLLCD